MSKHPKAVKGFEGSLEELAKAVGNMTYDQTASFIEKLAEDIKKQADGDYSGGRKKLSAKLYETAHKLEDAKNSMYDSWKICEPYMKNDDL